MKKYCFHPPKNIIVGTLAAMLWVAVFPFWLLGESTPLNALVSGEVPLWDALTRLTTQDYSNITRAKWDGMLIFTMLTLLLTISTLFHREKRRKLPLMLMLLFLLWIGLSCFFGSHAGEMNVWGVPTVLWGSGRYEGFVTIACYGLIFLCLHHMDANIPALLTVCSAAATGYLLLVLLQYAGFNPLSLFPMGRSIRTNYEFQGTIGNIDLVSAWVCLLMPGLLGSFVLGQKHHWLHLPGGLCAILLTLLMDVQSGLIVMALTLLALICLALRQPECLARLLLTLGLALLLFALRQALVLPWLDGFVLVAISPLLMGHSPRPLPRKRLLALVCAGLLVALILVAFLPMPEGGALWEMHELLNGRAQDAFGSERIGVWRMTLEMTAQAPWFGLSPDAFYAAFRDYLDATEQTILQNFDNPHNFFLQTMVNSGIPAALLLMLTCAAAIAGAIRKRETLPLTMMAVGFLAQGMFTFSICLTSPMFYAILGLCAAGTPKAAE